MAQIDQLLVGVKNRQLILSNTVAEPTDRVVCLERYHETMSRTNQPRGIRKALLWTDKFRPAEYTSNLRPGLPLWLFWTLQRRGVPCRGVITDGQLQYTTDDRHNDVLGLVREAWGLCSHRLIEETPEARDERVRTFGVPITIDNVLHGLPPEP